MCLSGIGPTNPTWYVCTYLKSLVGWVTVEQTASVLCPLGVFSSVQPGLVHVLGPVCAGAKRSGYIRWGDFQHTLAEHLALLPFVGHVESSSRVGTMGGLLDGVWHHDVC